MKLDQVQQPDGDTLVVVDNAPDQRGTSVGVDDRHVRPWPSCGEQGENLIFVQRLS